MEKICKIVYFDEESVTDYVQIVAGGELENTTELLKSRDAQEEQTAQANGPFSRSAWQPVRQSGVCRERAVRRNRSHPGSS